MEIIDEKKGLLSKIALFLGIVSICIGVIELVLIGMEAVVEDTSLFFFTSPGDAVFESSSLDHVMKAFANFIIGSLFLHGYPKIKKGSLDGFSFLIGAGFLALSIGFLFISVWVANLIDTAIIGITEAGVWEEFIITDGIRIEWFIAFGSIYILSVWKNREDYLK